MSSPIAGGRPSDAHRGSIMRGAIAALVVGLVAACGGGSAVAPTAASNDLLAAILARGTVVVATDPAYPPQSFAREDATRTPGSKCEPNQLTAGELDGYDVQTAVAVAKQLGVEPCFVAPQWTEITGGSWGDRWDISIGSMDISRDRMEVLDFAQPYYATPSVLFVHADSPVPDRRRPRGQAHRRLPRLHAVRVPRRVAGPARAGAGRRHREPRDRGLRRGGARARRPRRRQRQDRRVPRLQLRRDSPTSTRASRSAPSTSRCSTGTRRPPSTGARRATR